jgi:hypothetical protein
MSIRRWMVVVAFLAIALGCYLEVERLSRRRQELRLKAERQLKLAELYRRSRPGSTAMEYHAARARHYDAASRRWLLFELD